MKISLPDDKKRSSGIWPFLFLLLILGGGGIYWFSFGRTPAPLAPLVLQNIQGIVEISENGSEWKKITANSAVAPYTFLKTAQNAEADLRLGKSAFLRLKGNSQLQYAPPSVFSKTSGRLHLLRGKLLIANINENIQATLALKKDAPAGRGLFHSLKTQFLTIPPDSFLTLQNLPEDQSIFISNLRGHLTLESISPRIFIKFHDTETAQLIPGAVPKKDKITQADWRKAQEVYELKPKSSVTEAAQRSLSEKAGNFFEYVLDHGTFYQPKWGWCEREFFQPEDGTPVYMETTYDVFPKGSWVGLYLKNRNLDLSKFKTFKMEARKIPGRAFPQYVRIEFKAKTQVVQAFAIKMLRENWESIEFPLRVSKETPIREIIFVFSHEKVGSEKSGGLQLRNFTLIPKEKSDSAPAGIPLTAASKTLVTVGVNESAITGGTASNQNISAPAKTAGSETTQKEIPAAA